VPEGPSYSTYSEIIAHSRDHPRSLVEVDRDGPTALLRLNEPEVLNVLSPALVLQLIEAIDELAADDEIRSIILTGTDPAFCAGGDFRLMQNAVDSLDARDEEGTTGIWRFIRRQFGGVTRRIAGTDKAFIAAVNGAAAGVGLSFVMACDLIICSENAQIVPAFGRLGLIPEVGTSWFLTRRVGYQRAFDFYTSGEHLSGREAAELGLANECVEHDQLLPRCRERANAIAGLPAHAVAMAKPLLRQCADLSWDQALTMEELAEPNCFTTGHFKRIVAQLHPSGDGGTEPPGWPPPE
jgi:2-(1,2-epoxy-1,2-dihydrophenyl)acetyl-CoA isomerase